MSFRALPLQFLNLGGEMMYIIDQRLRAQRISVDRAHKVSVEYKYLFSVRNDILSIMLSKHFIEELFHPQPLYSKAALRTVFHKLAHASIMKLNALSMDKLFDLMLMSLKHQLVLAPQPRDLLLITLNHLDSMNHFATASDVFDQVQKTRYYFLKIYSHLIPSDWIDVRRDLLIFIQDLHVRVSIFLKTGIQDHFGKLILPTSGPVASGCEVPGTIRFFNNSGEISLVTLFPNGGNYACAVNTTDCAEICADRGTQLGLNIYSDAEKESYQLSNSTSSEETASQNFGPEDREANGIETSVKGREELNLLAHLIGTTSQASENKEFRLSLFLNDDRHDRGGIDAYSYGQDDVITIEGGLRGQHPELGKIMGELNVDDRTTMRSPNIHDDLLELLDSA